MKNPFKFGNRKARRAAAKRGAPTLHDLPEDMKPLVQTAATAKHAEDLIRKGRFDDTPPAHVHDMIDALRNLRAHFEQQLYAHPEFADYFPEDAQRIAEAQQQQQDLSKPAILDASGERVN